MLDRRLLVAVAGLCAAVLASAQTATGQPPYTSPYGPGFKASVGKAYVECRITRTSDLLCLSYSGQPPKGSQCSFGGTIASVSMELGKRPELGFVCVDEAYHDWRVLKRGKTFREDGFVCAHRRRFLRCRARGHSFKIDRRGRIRRPAAAGGAATARAASDRPQRSAAGHAIR